MACAVLIYQAELAKAPHKKKDSLITVCRNVTKSHNIETGREVKLDHGTLNRLVKGGRKLSEFNMEKSWVMKGEQEKILEYATSTAERGFPLSHRRLKEHVDEICCVRLGDKFPKDGVGINWTQHFQARNSDRLGMYTPCALDSAQARAVNLTTNAAWFKLLGKTLETGDAGKPIAQECCWGVNESGFQLGLGTTQEKVMGAAGKKSQYQQREGSRENITVIVTIGADGTSLAPAVIFKGKAYQPKWKQDNPMNAS